MADEKTEPVPTTDAPSKCSTSSPLDSAIAPNYPKTWNLAIITFSLALGTFLVALDTLIVGIAIPTITSQFRSLDDIAWYGSAYLITLTAIQPSFGRVYKLYSAKATYLVCVAVFEVGSIICAVAPKSTVFILGRAIAGCGAAGLFQGALNIITNTVPLEKRPLYLGIVISVWGISVCIGPVLGGAFTQNISWRWCFWINVPIGAVTFILVLIFFNPSFKNEKRQSQSLTRQLSKLDPVGAIAIIAATVCFFLALQWGGQSRPWNSSTVIGLFVGSGLLLSVFCFLQYKMGEDATTPLRVLKQRSILFGSLFLFTSAMPAYVYGYYLPIYLQSVKGSSPTKSGLEFMALALPQIVFIVVAGAVTTQWGYYVPYLIVGTAIQIVGSGLLITLDADTSTLKWAAYMVIEGIGNGIGVNLPYTAIQVVLREEDVPTGNAIAQFAYQLGAAIGLTIGQTLFLNKLTSEVSRRTTAVSPAAVIAAGAHHLPSLAQTPQLLRVLQQVYATAIKKTLLFALAMVCIAWAFTFGVENLNIKRKASRREENENEQIPVEDSV
ncbi:permease of the major facilitator superfamily [Trematosphaeria pertusa]|uniref:Permease of the major facilitator superfamily n=1 Tax=Trematosphaeria pertusa TaxID=390896 RepID=A0A6A6HXQ4_9PLEO|nr:permease of the major facilitator superfamily [Trematosphaeria pertusa]KAF2242995.1 permease of the major facilitator superfamily [Trematosphaeria pertusa]